MILKFISIFALQIIFMVSLHEIGHMIACISAGYKVIGLNILGINIIGNETYYAAGFIVCTGRSPYIRMAGYMTTCFINIYIGLPLIYKEYDIGFAFIYLDFIYYPFKGEFVEGLVVLMPDYYWVGSLLIFVFHMTGNAFVARKLITRIIKEIDPPQKEPDPRLKE